MQSSRMQGRAECEGNGSGHWSPAHARWEAARQAGGLENAMRAALGVANMLVQGKRARGHAGRAAAVSRMKGKGGAAAKTAKEW